MAADRERGDAQPEPRPTPEPPSPRSARMLRRAQQRLRRVHRVVDRGFTP